MSLLLRILRRLAITPGFRLLTRFRPLRGMGTALRGSLVDSPFRFALRELSPGSPVTTAYKVRGTDVSIAVRHQTPDIYVVDEIFSQREYEPPLQVDRLLQVRRPLKVVDLGANIGLFGAFVLSLYPDSEIVAVEADASNAAVHEQTIAANAREDSWELVVAYAGTTDGTVRFAPGSYATSHAAGEGEGIDVPAVDAFRYLGDADFVKIDIEGGEWPILRDPRLRELGAAAIVLEYHRLGSSSPDPAAEAERALVQAGYETRCSPIRPVSQTGLLWGWRT